MQMCLLLEKLNVGQNLNTEHYMRSFCVTITDNITTVFNVHGREDTNIDKSHRKENIFKK